MDTIDPGMLQLFQMEAQEGAQTLLAGLTPGSGADPSDLVRAAHSIRGAARIVNLDRLAELGRAMEETLEKGGLNESKREPLIRAAKIFSSLGRAEPDAAQDAIRSLASDVEQAIEALAAAAGEAVQPVEDPSAPSAPKVPDQPRPSQDDDLADESMLELFRTEAQDNANVLNSGIVEMEEAGPSPDTVEPLMRAAHSIKGAARIVGLDRIVGLAHAMEDAFNSALRDPAALPVPRLDQLLQATDVLAELAKAPAAALSGRLDELSGRIEDLAASLKGAPPARTESSEPAPAPPPPPPPEPKPARKPEPPAEPGPDLDASMLELFRVEAETNAQVLSGGLVELEETGASSERIEPLMRAAHSIKGAARIVGLAKAVDLAHAMEDVLSEAQHGQRVLDGGDVDRLLQGTDVLTRLSRTRAEDLPAVTEGMGPQMAALAQALRTGQAPPEASAAAAPTTEAQVSGAPAPVSRPAPAEAPAKPSPGPVETDGVVRISARNLSQLMALSGETLVETGRLAPFTASLLQMKNLQRETAAHLDGLREKMEKCDHAGAAKLLNQASEALAASRHLMAGHIEEFDQYVRRTDNLHNRLHNQVLAGRMRPFGEGVHGFPRLIRDISRSLGKKATLKIKGKDTKVDRDILDRLEAPLNHLLRNAVDHGLESPEERISAGKPETGVITLEARHSAGMLAVTVSDDGRGMDPERIRAKVIARSMAAEDMARRMTRAELMEFLFLPGFTTTDKVTEISGRGVGLDVVHTMIQEVGGTVRAESTPGHGMTFNMQMPLTLSVLRTLLVEVADQPFALQLTRLDRILDLPASEVRLLEDKQYFVLEGSNIGLAQAAQILDLPVKPFSGDVYRIVVISDRMNRYGLAVDRFLGERDLVVRPVDARLGKIRDVYASARLPDGSPVFILDVEDLVRSVDALLQGKRLTKLGRVGAAEEARDKQVLVVDDSLTVREVERKLLENAGFEVQTAVNGMDGLNAAQIGRFDLIITDVDMPRMNGVELVRQIKADPQLAATPIMIVSYKDREEDRLAGLDAGADYYLTKGSFHDETLLQAVYDLIGEP